MPNSEYCVQYSNKPLTVENIFTFFWNIVTATLLHVLSNSSSAWRIFADLEEVECSVVVTPFPIPSPAKFILKLPASFSTWILFAIVGTYFPANAPEFHADVMFISIMACHLGPIAKDVEIVGLVLREEGEELREELVQRGLHFRLAVREPLELRVAEAPRGCRRTACSPPSSRSRGSTRRPSRLKRSRPPG